MGATNPVPKWNERIAGYAGSMSTLAALPDGTVLGGDFRIVRVLGAGGFGITYLADETPLARKVTIKEYFPVDFAARDNTYEVVPRSRASEDDYEWGLERFLDEAQTLARFKHPNIVSVYRYFRARNTGYIAMQFEEGQSFKSWLNTLGRAPRQPELDRILAPLLDALEHIHRSDFLHRDIAPDNIIIRNDGTPVLIDFGSARGEIASHTKTLSALVKPGYSPYEQYATTASRQGPWTDIYSLAATLYHAVTGKRPPDAPSRMVADEMIPVRNAALSAYRPGFLAAIDHGLRLEMDKRPKSIAVWRDELMAAVKEPAKAAAKAPASARATPATSAAPERETPKVAAVAAAPKAAEPAAKKEAPVAAAASLPRTSPTGGRGIVGAFLDGWRKGTADPVASAPVSPPKKAEAPALIAARPDASPPAARESKPAPAKTPAVEKAVKAKPVAPTKAEPQVAQAAQLPVKAEPKAEAVVDAEPRRAPPRAIRAKGSWRWKPLAAKLAIGAGVAALAVSFQDQLPHVRSEGSGTVLSQNGDTVALGDLKGHRGTVNALTFTNDGRSLVTAGTDGTIKVWNAATRALTRTLELEHGAANGMAVDGRRAVTGHGNGRIAVWDLETGARLAAFQRNDQSVWSVAFLGDPDLIVAAAHDSAVAVWDVRQPAAPISILEGHDSAAQAVAFSANGGLIASGSADKTVRLWRAEGMTSVRIYRGHNDYVTALAFSPDGRKLASASLDGQIRVWSTLSSRLHFTLRGHKSRVTALTWAPDGETMVSASDDGSLRVWNIKQGRSIRAFQIGSGELKAVGFAPDGRRLAAAGTDGLVRLYNATITRPGI